MARVDITCAYAGGGAHPHWPQPLLRNPVWSQTMTTPGTTAQAAPTNNGITSPVFEVRATVDVFVAGGATPDASQAASVDPGSTRIFVPASTTVDIYCSAGDRLAWVAA